MFNLFHEHYEMVSKRSEIEPDYLCYVQDDCLIQYPATFFSTLVSLYESHSEEKLAYISGFYTPLHPGFEKTQKEGITVLKSDTIDGKHLMAPPEVFRRIGKLTWHFPDGMRRGNPGPVKGSRFDLWQWRDSPDSIQKQGAINLIVPGLIKTIAQSKRDSTWNNNGDNPQNIVKRVKKGKVYSTRETIPSVEPTDYYQP